MFPAATLLCFTLLAIVRGQQVGTVTAENHPSLSVQQCTGRGVARLSLGPSSLTRTGAGCTRRADTRTATPATLGTYGITTSGNALTLKFVTQSQQKNIGSRVYLMADQSHYQMFHLKNQEFTFDVDMSNLPCGLNGALYFVEMDADGGMTRFPTNKAGAKYGTGYCDTQCPHDIKFINGEANVEGWAASASDPNAGTGMFGSCCNEMDVWEANSMAAAVTPHVCSVQSQTRCSGTQCGDGDERYDGICDKDGCDFNSFRMGDKTFLGPGMTVDTRSKFTVVTQFLTADNTTTGSLSEIRRLYVQNGRVIQNSKVNIPGMAAYDSITDEFCNAQKEAFGDTNTFESLGGLKQMGTAFDNGMSLVMSVWDDHAVNMLWLDSDYPTDATSGQPAQVESQSASASASVVFSNITAVCISNGTLDFF
ncbi:hypothetical protein ACEPAF_368 [Sanghuangporus sanghuang]